MATPLALVTADWHVRKADRVWYRRDELYGDTAWGVEQLVRLADKFDVPYVLLAGDLFEQKMQPSDALLVMRKALDRFEAQEREVLYIQGQHEKSAPPLLTAFHAWPDYIDNEKVELGDSGLTIVGLDYRNPTEVQAALRAVEPADIIMTHQVWRDFMGEDRGDAWFSWLPADIGVVLTGDFHQSVNEDRDGRTIVSPGSICMQNIGETPDKYAAILFDDMTVQLTPLTGRGYYETRLHDDKELTQFLDTWVAHPARQPKQGVPSEVSRNLLRVYYSTEIEDARQRIETAVAADVHLFLTAIAAEQGQLAVVDSERQQAVLSGGLEGCVDKFYRDNPHVHEDAMRLVRTNNLSDEITNIFKHRISHGFDTN